MPGCETYSIADSRAFKRQLEDLLASAYGKSPTRQASFDDYLGRLLRGLEGDPYMSPSSEEPLGGHHSKLVQRIGDFRLRKIRLPVPGLRGKRGGARLIYAVQKAKCAIVLVSLYLKSKTSRPPVKDIIRSLYEQFG